MNMVKIGAVACLALLTTAPGAVADKARVVACYKEVTVPARYDVKKVLVKETSRQYVRRNGLVLLLEYPAIYREDKTLVEAEHVLMREVVCKQ
ncbi:hypothetical protein [Roseovarius dicentrarchi]|uniref:hypothetical protein n=1 Tax=Roseovarius dicentrarchi TaxID=2250573 RepID=UPI000DE9C711|nr:hypothetical protein [Roseovarius dicentrarchi]